MENRRKFHTLDIVFTRVPWLSVSFQQNQNSRKNCGGTAIQIKPLDLLQVDDLTSFHLIDAMIIRM